MTVLSLRTILTTPYFACTRNLNDVWVNLANVAMLKRICRSNLNMLVSFEKKANIKALLEKDVSYRSIAKSLGLGVGSVSRIRKEFDIPTSNVAGQPKKISTLLGRKIFRSFNTGKYTNAVDASKMLEAKGTPLSPQTVRNFLVSTGFKSGLKKAVLLLTPSRRKARLVFAKKYHHFNKNDWLRRVYTVEIKINRLGSDGKQ